MMRADSLRASASWLWYSARTVSASVRFGLGGVEVAADPLGAGLHGLLGLGHAELPEEEEDHGEAEGTPDDLVRLGQQRVRRLLALLDRAALGEDLDALGIGVGGPVLLGLVDDLLDGLTAALTLLGGRGRGHAGEAEESDEDDRGCCEEQSDSSHQWFSVSQLPWPRKNTTKPMSASASTNAMPRNMVVRTMPAASG